MPVEMNEISAKSNGGTELMGRRLQETFPELLENFQIVLSRVRDLDESKVRILWCHDLPEDPESQHLKDGGWIKFHKIVFVSYTQRDAYIREFGIPYSHCTVIRNAIVPIDVTETDKSEKEVRLIYHTTPHRGLELLVPVFNKLCETHDDIHLDVFSSFDIYGWKERDTQFEPLFEAIKLHPKMTYHGFQPQEVVRESLVKTHIFAYPSMWTETSCLSLMEAMSARCYCVHSDLGALPETAANWTLMYDFNEDRQRHAGTFYGMLGHAIDIARERVNSNEIKLKGQKSYVDLYYNWEVVKAHWLSLLEAYKDAPTEMLKTTGPMFNYRVG